MHRMIRQMWREHLQSDISNMFTNMYFPSYITWFQQETYVGYATFALIYSAHK